MTTGIQNRRDCLVRPEKSAFFIPGNDLNQWLTATNSKDFQGFTGQMANKTQQPKL